jgi:tungstate transport system substrate-binding protein
MRTMILLLLLVAATAHADSATVVRLAVVNTPQFSGLLDSLLPDFEAESGLKVEVYAGNDVYPQARAGKADIIISHYGKDQVEGFVLEGYGSWPRMVFANQIVLVGHKSDPAKIRGMRSAAAALKKIADAGAPFIANASPRVDYLTGLLWESAGRPAREGWFVDAGRVQVGAVLLAEERRGYTIWGAEPFLRFASLHETELEVLVSADPVLQRVLAAVIVRREKLPGVNVEGATALRDYLLSPRTQAKIAAFRSPRSDQQLWWPAGQDN